MQYRSSQQGDEDLNKLVSSFLQNERDALKTTQSAKSVERILVFNCSGSVAWTFAFMVIFCANSSRVKQPLCAVTSASGIQSSFHPMVKWMAGWGRRGRSRALWWRCWLESDWNKAGKVMLRLEVISASRLLGSHCWRWGELWMEEEKG